jgi:hypothetical protein
MREDDPAQLGIQFSGVGKQYRQHIDALADGLAKLLEPMQDELSATATAISKVDFPKLQLEMKQSCERLANLGWTLPMSFTPGQLVELAEHGNTDEQIEQYMLDYFSVENGCFFLALRRNVLASANLKGWRALLEECFDAYDCGHYLVPIPALLSVIEGAVARYAGKLRDRQVNPKKLAADLEKTAQPGGIRFLVWRSSRLVLERLFAGSDFRGLNPGELNRHWVLHGRDQMEWTQTDALRLFNLLATIS